MFSPILSCNANSSSGMAPHTRRHRVNLHPCLYVTRIFALVTLQARNVDTLRRLGSSSGSCRGQNNLARCRAVWQALSKSCNVADRKQKHHQSNSHISPSGTDKGHIVGLYPRRDIETWWCFRWADVPSLRGATIQPSGHIRQAVASRISGISCPRFAGVHDSKGKYSKVI